MDGGARDVLRAVVVLKVHPQRRQQAPGGTGGSGRQDCALLLSPAAHLPVLPQQAHREQI